MMKLISPIFRIFIAFVLGVLVLMLCSSIMLIIANSTNLFNSFPVIEKIFTHTAMLLFSIIFILLVNNGKLRDYGFTWSIKFPVKKIVLISLLLGLLSFLISKLLPESDIIHPAASFSILEKILFIWVWASISEEILTRGLIQGFLAPLKHYGINLFNKFISMPVIVGAIFFGIMHFALLSLGMNLVSVINIVVFGIVLGLIAGYQKEKTNSLIPAIIVHFCFNVGASIISLFNI